MRVYLEFEIDADVDIDGNDIIINGLWLEKPENNGLPPRCCDLTNYTTDKQDEHVREQVREWIRDQADYAEAAAEDAAEARRDGIKAEQYAERSRIYSELRDRGKVL